MADEIRFEAWTLPESGTFTRKLAIGPVADFQLQVRNSQVGSGSLSLPDDYTEKDQILYIDQANHANDEGSLIRAFRDDQVLGEWYALRMSDTFSDEDPLLQVSGETIERVLDKMIVLPYDYPADPIVDPDWIYGAESILDNTGFEQGGSKHEIQTVWNNATGGTFRLTLDAGVNYTDPIAYNAAPSVVQTRLETDLPQVTTCDVLGTGTSANPWRIEFIDPTDPGATLTSDDASLTGGTTTIALQTAGGAGEFGKWTQSLNPVSGQWHGIYDTFEVSTDQARTGTYSLKIDGGAPTSYQQWPGGQQIVKVIPGRQYRAEIWIWSTSSTDPFVLIMRDTEENFIASSGPVTLTASTWTKVEIPSFTIPAGVTSMIFRAAYIGGSNPAIFYLDDASLAPGFAAATHGAIFGDLLDDLNTHVTVGSWLTRSFSDTLDSAGNAWDQSLSWAIKRGQSLLQLLEYAKRWGYEYRIRWTGTVHALDLFNPGGMGTDYSTADTPAIVGRISGSGPLVRRAPDFTWMLAEGDQGARGVAEDTTLTGAFSKWMSYWANRTARTSAGLATAAAQRIADMAQQTEGFIVRVQDPTAGNLPLEDILIGDEVQVSLPGKQVKASYRAAALTISGDAESAPIYEWHLSSQVFTPEAAVAEGVNRLLRSFQGLENTAPGAGEEAIAPFTYPTSEPGGSPGFTFRVAASNASDGSKASADYVCDGTDDHVEINLALAAAGAISNDHGDGRVLLSEGEFWCSVGQISVPEGVTLQGMGTHATILNYNNDISGTGNLITLAGNFCEVHDLSLFENSAPTGTAPRHGIYAGTSGAQCKITNCFFSWVGRDVDYPGYAIYAGGLRSIIQNNRFEYSGGDIFVGGSGQTLVENNIMYATDLLSSITVDNTAYGSIIRGNSILSGSEQPMINIGQATDIVIANNTLEGSGGSATTDNGIVLGTSSTNIAVIGNTIKEVNNGIRPDGEGHTIIGNSIGWSATLAGEGIVNSLGAGSSRTSIVGNTIYNWGATAGAYGISIATGGGLVIANNVILSGTGGGAGIAAERLGTYGGQDVTIQGNVCRDVNGPGVSIATLTGFVIADNTVTGDLLTSTRAIEIQNTSNSGVVTGNTVHRVLAATPATYSFQYGIYVAGNNVQVTGNHILYAYLAGIIVTGDRCLVTDNQIEQGRRDGIQLSSTASYCTVADNHLWQGGQETDDTYSGILVDGDLCTIIDNFVGHGSGATQYQYGISITATASTTICSGNSLNLAGRTGPINDAGTGSLFGPSADEWNLGTSRTTGDVLYWDAAGEVRLKTITEGGAGSDTTAIHDDTSGEISAVTEKTAPVAADLILIEDSAASNAKKKVQLGNLPGTYGELYAANNATETTISVANTWTQVTEFTSVGQSNGTTPSATTDDITIGTTGIYLILLSASLSSGTGSGGTYEGEIQKNNGATRLTNIHWDRELSGGGGDTGSVSASGLASLTASDTIELWVRCTTTTNLLLEDVNLSLYRIG